jgi:hypothetical protein
MGLKQRAAKAETFAAIVDAVVDRATTESMDWTGTRAAVMRDSDCGCIGGVSGFVGEGE